MPIYEYQGKHYELSETDPSAAKVRIQSSIDKSITPKEEKKEKGFSEKLSPFTDVANRALVAGTLGAPVDIAAMAMKPFGYKEKEPFGGSEYIGKQMERAGMVTPTRRPMAELLTGVAPAVLGLGGAAVSKGVGALSKLGKSAVGTESRELGKALKTGMTGRAEDVISGAEAAQVQPQKQVADIAKAQVELGGRGKVAGARQTAREKEVDTVLDTVSKNKNVLAEDVGSVIQPVGRENINKLKETRQQGAIKDIKDPAFTEAKTREANGDFIATNPKSSQKLSSVLSEVESQINKTPEPYQSQLRSRYASIKGKEVPLSEAELRVEQLRASVSPQYQPKTSKVEPMTLDEAEFLRRMLKDKNLSNIEGFSALDANRMNKLGDKVAEAMAAYEPRVGQYISKYKELSEPVSRAMAGRGKALTEVEIAAEENALFSADKKSTANYFLDGSEEKANRLLDLVGGRTTKIMEPIKGFFRTQLDGMNAKQAQDFVKKQEGFLRVFPELREPMNKVVSAKRTAETAGVFAEKRAGEAATRLTGKATGAEKSIAEQQKIADKYNFSLNQISTSTPKDSVSVSRKMADDMRRDKIINDDTHRQLLSQIDSVDKQYGKTTEARKRMAYVVGSAAIPAIGVTGYYKLKAVLGL